MHKHDIPATKASTVLLAILLMDWAEKLVYIACTIPVPNPLLFAIDRRNMNVLQKAIIVCGVGSGCYTSSFAYCEGENRLDRPNEWADLFGLLASVPHPRWNPS